MVCLQSHRPVPFFLWAELNAPTCCIFQPVCFTWICSNHRIPMISSFPLYKPTIIPMITTPFSRHKKVLDTSLYELFGRSITPRTAYEKWNENIPLIQAEIRLPAFAFSTWNASCSIIDAVEWHSLVLCTKLWVYLPQLSRYIENQIIKYNLIHLSAL